MQTIVKIFIAFIFSHLSVSEGPKETSTEKEQIKTSIEIKVSSCASAGEFTVVHLS